MILKKLLIIDGSFMLHRGLKQQHIFDLRNSNLERTGGIYTFLNSLQKEIKINSDYFPIICWDNGLSSRRLSLYDNYKKHRDKIEDPEHKPFSEMTDDELDEDYVYNYKLQRKKLIKILNNFGIPSLLFKHTEGDDLMYWLSKHCNKSIVITDDKDLLQLVNETCSVRQPMKDRIINKDNFESMIGISTVDDFIKIKALLGDSSDNIPSACFRIGEKTALNCLKTYEALVNEEKIDILNDVDKLKDFCKSHEIPFKSAYCNFDKERYLTNIELVDLRKIQNEEINEDAIYDSIKNVYKSGNIKNVLELLNFYEIKTVNTNIIFESLVMNKYNIKD